jgi:hypothetical protein
VSRILARRCVSKYGAQVADDPTQLVGFTTDLAPRDAAQGCRPVVAGGELLRLTA